MCMVELLAFNVYYLNTPKKSESDLNLNTINLKNRGLSIKNKVLKMSGSVIR